VSRTHQFLVTLTVHTNKINPATTPTATSATSMTNEASLIVIPRDGQQTIHGISRISLCWATFHRTRIDRTVQSVDRVEPLQRGAVEPVC
jgi:hypothetical protein